jgi:hypothetical protein
MGGYIMELFKLFNKQESKRLLEILENIMTSLQTLSTSITNLTTAVSLIPAGAPVTGDPGLTAAQTLAAAAAIDAQTKILTADVAANPALPPAPTGVAIVSSGGGNAALTFSPVVGATGYLVETSTTTGTETGPGTPIAAPAATVPPTPVPFSIGGLVVGTTYFAVVLAVNAAGTGPASAEVSFVA